MESFTLHKAPKVWKYSLIWASKADTHFGCWRHWFSVTWILHTGNFTDVTGITWVLQWCHAKGGGSYESARKGRCRRDKMTRKTCKLDLAASSQHHLILKNAVPAFGTEEWPQLVAEALSPWVPEVGGAEDVEVKAARKQHHLRDHECGPAFKIQLLSTQLGASCKAETKPMLINPCQQGHLEMHPPEGFDAGLNEVLHTINETASGPELLSFPKTKCL